MYQIEENAKLEMENVISFRGVVTHAQINERVSEMLRVIEANNAFKTGSVVNTTFSIDPNGVEPLLDVEILIPINRKINLSAPYSYKPIFKLNNAIKVKHYGAPETVH